MARMTRPILVAGLALQVFLLAACSDDESSPETAADSGEVEAVAATAINTRSGEEIWATCGTCHGMQGEGNRELAAPALVNQDAWYLRRQMLQFRNGGRGASAGDATGSQMATMAKALPDEQAVDSVVDYIVNELAASVPATTIQGDVSNGRDHYDMICGACHGPGGEGNEILGAPRLAGIDDWYLVEQYRKFAEGQRGADENDKYGQQMQMMAGVLPDQQTIHNVVAYIQAQVAE